MAHNNKRKGHRVSRFLALKSSRYILNKWLRCTQADACVYSICVGIMRDRGVDLTSPNFKYLSRRQDIPRVHGRGSSVLIYNYLYRAAPRTDVTPLRGTSFDWVILDEALDPRTEAR
jgi:hypothetical protein